jgi:uncharacterized damage-inducible protein DinB
MIDMLARPDTSEFDPYYGHYVGLVPDGDIVTTLRAQIESTAALLRGMDPDQEVLRYAPGKWSVREVVGHVIDTERVFALRALCFARRDPAPLPSFDQDDYAAQSNAHLRPMSELLDELLHVRASTVALLQGFDPLWGQRRGIASDRPFTVRAIAWIIAGHELHHRGVLNDRYLARTEG